MIATLFLALVLFVLAYLAWRYLPEPIGTIAAVVLVLVGLYVVIRAVLGTGDAAAAVVASPLAVKLLR